MFGNKCCYYKGCPLYIIFVKYTCKLTGLMLLKVVLRNKIKDTVMAIEADFRNIKLNNA